MGPRVLSRGDVNCTGFRINRLEKRIAPSNANFPAGQFPSTEPGSCAGAEQPQRSPAANPNND